MQINPYLKLMADKQASDLFFSAGAPVNIRIEGKTSQVNDKALPPGMVQQLAYRIMNDDQKKLLKTVWN